MNMYYDNRNNHIYFTDAYSIKDSLKAKGFHFNGYNKVWYITPPASETEAANFICDLFVDCDVDFFDLCDFAESYGSKTGHSLTSMDADHLEKYMTVAAKYYH